jgi:methylmalonyl-CoA/ethylmalonyl-CoA epimerase
MMDNKLRFHHIGIACHDIDTTKPFYVTQGYSASETVKDPIQNVYICFLEKSNMPLIELLAPVDEESPVNRILKTSGVTPYHICYEVNDIDAAVKELKSQHFVLVSRPVPACALDGKRVCFLYNKTVGLIELVSK